MSSNEKTLEGIQQEASLMSGRVMTKQGEAVAQQPQTTKRGRRLIRVCRNVNRPGLKPRRKKYWQRKLQKIQPDLGWYVYLGPCVCNPYCYTNVVIKGYP